MFAGLLAALGLSCCRLSALGLSARFLLLFLSHFGSCSSFAASLLLWSSPSSFCFFGSFLSGLGRCGRREGFLGLPALLLRSKQIVGPQSLVPSLVRVLRIVPQQSKRLLALFLQQLARALRTQVIALVCAARLIHHAKTDLHSHVFLIDLFALHHEAGLLHCDPLSNLPLAANLLLQNLAELGLVLLGRLASLAARRFEAVYARPAHSPHCCLDFGRRAFGFGLRFGWIRNGVPFLRGGLCFF